jgi:hypothetical protein
MRRLINSECSGGVAEPHFDHRLSPNLRYASKRNTKYWKPREREAQPTFKQAINGAPESTERSRLGFELFTCGARATSDMPRHLSSMC